jgi:hypothetical protein
MQLAKYSQWAFVSEKYNLTWKRATMMLWWMVVLFNAKTGGVEGALS